MPPRIDISGQRFGQLTVVQQVGSKNNRPLWECVCDCGCIVFHVSGELRAGRAQQCRECGIKSRTLHGCSSTTRQRESREYRSWNGARSRCRNTKDKSFPNYGGRGIIFSAVWDDFHVFLRDMGPCPNGFTLDRIDVNGHYEPSNCRWASVKTQQNNRRVNRRIEYKGKTLTIAQWADNIGISQNYLFSALRAGYSIGDVIARIETGQRHKKMKFRGDNSAASKLTTAVVNQIIEEYRAIPNSGSRKPKGTRQMLAAKYGVCAHRIGAIVGGRTNWTTTSSPALRVSTSPRAGRSTNRRGEW